MLAEGTSNSTVELRVMAMRLCVRHAEIPITSLSADHLRAWLAGYPNPNTKSTYYAAVARFHVWIVAERLREDNPLALIRKPRVPQRVPRPCTSPALRLMLATTRQRDRDMMVLAAYQGLRRAEISQVRGEDIDTYARTMHVVGKGGSAAILPLHPLIAEMADRYPVRGWWFPSRRRPGCPITPQVVTIAVQRACADAEVPGVGAHPLRHWHATELVRSGADLRTVQVLMRHASLATTAGYVKASDEALREASAALPDLTGGPEAA